MPALLKTFRAADEELNRVQRNVSDAVDQLKRLELLDGVLIRDVALASGANIVSHGLGRQLRGWLPVRKGATCDIWDTQSANPAPENTLFLSASAAVTISLWVF